jgi:hypothetical protein
MTKHYRKFLIITVKRLGVGIPGVYLYLMCSWVFIAFFVHLYFKPDDILYNIDYANNFFVPFTVTLLLAVTLNAVNSETKFWNKISKGAKWFILNCCYLLWAIASMFITSGMHAIGCIDYIGCPAGSLLMIYLPSIIFVCIMSCIVAIIWEKIKNRQKRYY